LVSLSELSRTPNVSVTSGTTNFEQAEREHNQRVLKETNWVLGGVSGAAAKLGMKRTTLWSKMKKLGISRAS